MNITELKILKLTYDILGITFDELAKKLKINPKLLKKILWDLENKNLIEKRHFPNGKVDYNITKRGFICLKKFK